MSSKFREAVSRLVREIEDGMLVELSSKFEQDLAKSLLADVKTALAEPPRNCDVGSVEEQDARHSKWCCHYGIDGTMDVPCAHPDMSCSLCILRWSQLPHEKEADNEQK